jgi:hypothetical protein
MSRCTLLTTGSAADPPGFTTWWLANGQPQYMSRSYKWVRLRSESNEADLNVLLVTVGWSLTEEGEVWPHARCLIEGNQI